jgi:ABC-type phosphate transport system substrate-binding protein
MDRFREPPIDRFNYEITTINLHSGGRLGYAQAKCDNGAKIEVEIEPLSEDGEDPLYKAIINVEYDNWGSSGVIYTNMREKLTEKIIKNVIDTYISERL